MPRFTPYRTPGMRVGSMLWGTMTLGWLDPCRPPKPSGAAFGKNLRAVLMRLCQGLICAGHIDCLSTHSDNARRGARSRIHQGTSHHGYRCAGRRHSRGGYDLAPGLAVERTTAQRLKAHRLSVSWNFLPEPRQSLSRSLESLRNVTDLLSLSYSRSRGARA
jgi:hypothetical protein